MAAASFILLPGPTQWLIGPLVDAEPALHPVAIPTEVSFQQTAQILREELNRHGYRGGPTLLALPSAWCLCASFSMDRLPRKDRRQAMLYRFEEKLPVAVEELVVDFIQGINQSLGIGVLRSRLEPLVEALEGAGITVQQICPSALLAAQSILPQLPQNAAGLLWHEEDRIELLPLASGRLSGWYNLPAQSQEVLLHVRQLLQVDPEHPLFAINSPPGLCSELNLQPVDPPSRSLAFATVAMGRQTLSAKTDPLVDLRRDALAPLDPLRAVRTPLAAATAAGILLILCFCIILLWRGHHYQQLTHQLEQRQQALFRRALPGVMLHGSAKLRLLSEQRKLEGLSGEATALSQPPSALLLLQQTLSHLPSNLRYRLLELRLSPEHIDLEGQARAHSDADAIAASLRQQADLIVEPPRTEQLSGQGVGFSIHALMPPKSSHPTASALAGGAP